MSIALGDMEHQHLPKYIAVQVSAARWLVAELIAEQNGEGWSTPVYKVISERLDIGSCNNRLRELQGKASHD